MGRHGCFWTISLDVAGYIILGQANIRRIIMKVKIRNKDLEELYLSLVGDNRMTNLSQEDSMFLEQEYGKAILSYEDYLAWERLPKKTTGLGLDLFYLEPYYYIHSVRYCGTDYIVSLPKQCRVMIVKKEFGITREIVKVVNLSMIALDFDIASLRFLYREDKDKYEQIKRCYLETFKKGKFELANNLGVLAYDIEKDEYKAKEFFILALAHKSVTAFKNIVTVLWNEEKYEQIYKFLKTQVCCDCSMYAQNFRILGVLNTCGIFLYNHINLTKPLMLLMPQLKLQNHWYLSIENVFYKSIKYCMENNCMEFVNSARYVRKCRIYVANSMNSNITLEQSEETTFVGERDFSILKHIEVQKTESAIWDVYLLMSVKYFFISKRTKKRYFVLQNSDLAGYMISIPNSIALKPYLENNHFLPTVQIKDEQKGYSAHVYCCYILDDDLVREHVVMKVCAGKITSYKLADKAVYVYGDLVNDDNPFPF